MARQILGKVVPTGEDTYNNNRTYDELCIVMYNGQSYISKKETRGNKPDNTEYWQQLVEKPVKGTDYFTEADKDEIVNDVTNDATNKYNQAVATGIETFNQNAERKTSDFNDNASEKTDTYNANVDSAMKTFTNNANSKTEAYNTNATEKLSTYNSNHTAKLKEYNDNATSKLSAYNTNTVTKTTEYNSNHTNKLNAYDTNASSKIDEYNTNADARLEEYNTNADNKIAEYDEHSKELNNKIVSTRNELERLKSNVLNTGEDTDTFIHLEDSAMAELQEIKVDGVLQQNTTTGKNLLNVPKDLQKIKNDSYSITPVYSNGMLKYIELNGTFNAWTAYNILGAEFTLSPGTYVQSFHKEGKFSNGSVYIDSSLSITSIEIDNYSKVLSDDLNVSKYKICVNEGTVCNNLKLYPMIAKENKVSNYEPFTNGASPSPDFPQEIKTITDSLKVTSCGKNLFNINKTTYPKTENGLTITTENGYFIINGTCTRIYANISNPKNFVISAGTYTISIDTPQNFNVVLKRFLPNGSAEDIVILHNSLAKTFTTGITSNSYYFFISGLTPGMTIDNVKFKIQFERKDNATSIEDYIESQIQAKLPEGEFIGKLDETYKDTLRAEYFPEEGQYHLMLDKKVGKYTFTGNEGWFMNYGTGMFHANNIFKTASELTRLGKCTHYIYNSINSSIFNTLPNNQFAIQYYNGSTNIFIKDLRYSSVDDFKNMLKTNNIEIYYILQTPYTLDLGVIDMPMSYKDITNIFTDSDLLPTINAKYYRVFDKTIQNVQINEKTLKQEITDLNATVSSLDNRLKALETKTVEEPTESEGTV